MVATYMNTITCPHCKKTLEISEAIVHQLQEQVREEEHKKLSAEFAKKQAEEAATQEKKLREKFELDNKLKMQELEEAKKKERELLEKIKLDAQKLEESEIKIREQAKKEAEERFHEDLLKEKKKNADMQKALDEAKRKAEQSSQQLQGEVLELDLEKKLHSAFPSDQFSPVPKGFRGGDIIQKIIYKQKIIGSIVWEMKNTKDWSRSFLLKLKEDAGRVNASESIIVSKVLPNDVTNFDRIEGVWITSYEHAITICRFVRFFITNMAAIKSSASHTDEEWGRLREYMLSDAFKNKMQGHFDSVKILREVLEADKRSASLRWRKQEAVIEKMDNNMVNFYAELREIVPGMPKVEGVDTLLLDSPDDTSTYI